MKKSAADARARVRMPLNLKPHILPEGAELASHWLGSGSGLFEIGKFLIAFYVGKLGLQSTYGAAASLVMLLIWVYYSSQIVLFGAEFTHAYARRRQRREA